MDAFIAFLGISVLVIVTPGPDTALTIRNTLAGGRAAGLMSAAGIAAGQSVWALATSAGLVALLVASEPVFLALKLAGAAYLAWLGLQSLRTALRRGATSTGAAPGAPIRLGPGAAFWQGLISDLGNPKMAVFFASVLPQFAPAGQGMFSALVMLGLVFALMTLAWLALYAALLGTATGVLRRAAVRRGLEGVTGLLLIGLGVRLATQPR